MSEKTLSGKSLAWLLTVVYFASYVTRINFAAVIQEIVTDTGYEKAALSIILVCVSVTYGLGQLINGRLGDIIKPQTLIFVGLIISTVINFVFPFTIFSIPLMAVLWGINGFAQAMMWPPMVKILVALCDDKMYGWSVIRISWGSSFGTILVYLAAPLVISVFGWGGVFIASAIIGLATTILWISQKGRILLPDASDNSSCGGKSKFSFEKTAVFSMIFIVLAIIFMGMLRDGITSWMPTYLAEVFSFGNKESILCTVSLAVFSIICFSVAGKVYQRFFKNEVACAMWIFALSALSSVILFVFFDIGGAVMAIFLMAMITGCMHGVNLMLITHVPKRFKKYGNISTVSGALNACTYVGAAISSYAVALLADGNGWRFTVAVWGVIALLGTAACLVAMLPWKRFIFKD